ncbi:CopG family transcriptional regulator [Methylobacterium sp. Leaf111]|uniref:type II toxin-antitoxin system RelB family antitoxin n=1 Tax=Methylobacterium sp. Leaf111 TaxID=1736257 RepID=UPI0006FC5E9C|nr:TraY domain-containing protein [Methylobacterium sp. Leaf111]KQP59985.1 CopG family transcriptional regulator [Methylobacterium sp. Leaf111]
MLALRLPPEIEDRLEALARRTGRSKADHARDAILEHLENLEDLDDAERRLAAVRSGESDTVPLDDLLSRYGVAD